MNLQRYDRPDGYRDENGPILTEVQSGPLIRVRELEEVCDLIDENFPFDYAQKWKKLREMLSDDNAEIEPHDPDAEWERYI